MKKTLILGLLGLAATVATTYGQGLIALDNYDSTAHPKVLYGAGTGGTTGAAITTGGFTAGFYFVNVAGNNVASFASDPNPGLTDPATLYSGPGALILATGSGSSGGINNSDTGTAGEYAPPTSFNPGFGAGATVTMMVIAYNNGSWANGTFRGHSTAFTMTTSTGSNFPFFSGDSETDGGFSVHPVPEPSTFALAGLGAAALLAFRRKK